jgi:sorting nexin-1/2
VKIVKVHDKNLHDEAERAKNQLLQELNSMTVKDVNFEDVTDKEDPKSKVFSVSNPVKTGGHIKYTIVGVDSDGEFTEVRRFKEFYSLRNILVQRWPGIYIPALPEKKIVVS